MSGPLDRLRKMSLVRGAYTADPARQDFPSFGNEMREKLSIFEIDISDLLGAKLADSLASNRKPSWSWHDSLKPLFLVRLHSFTANEKKRNLRYLSAGGKGRSLASILGLRNGRRLAPASRLQFFGTLQIFIDPH